MADVTGAICKDCRHEFEYLSGGFMTGYQKVCDTCGESLSVPRFAPAGSYELSEQGLRQWLRSDGWERQGRPFTEAEQINLEKLTNRCQCGGAMVVDDGEGSVAHRCPTCRSVNLETEWRGMAD